MITAMDDTTMLHPPVAGLSAGVWAGVLSLLEQTPQAPCLDADPNLFFAEAPADIDAAKAICGDCPSRGMCLSGAPTRREPHGVWGGELFQNGEVIARKRPRGRPRKTPVEAPLVASEAA